MRDTTNILLGCDLRQAEVAELCNILSKETKDTKGNPQRDYSLLVKLAKGAIDGELAETSMSLFFCNHFHNSFNPIHITDLLLIVISLLIV